MPSVHEQMIGRVARALGDDLASKVAFVGGCATALLVTDEQIQSEVRFTEDVDVIVHVLGYGQWRLLEQRLAQRGFVDSQDDAVLCRKRLRDGEAHELIVDFMPDDERILGFSNRWYAQALESAIHHSLTDGCLIRLVSAPYFLGTKLEAYKGRGNADPMASRDVEDLINLVAGRPSLIDEFHDSPRDLRRSVASALEDLMGHRDFDYAVASACRNAARERHVLERFDALVAAG